MTQAHVPSRWIRQGTHADARADNRAFVALTRGHWSYATYRGEPLGQYATREEAQAAADIAIPTDAATGLRGGR